MASHTASKPPFAGDDHRFATNSAGLRLAEADSICIALVNCRSEPECRLLSQSSFEENYAAACRCDDVPDASARVSAGARVQTGRRATSCFTESDLRDYPGLWLRRCPGTSRRSRPTSRAIPWKSRRSAREFKQSLRVTRRADYIARTDGHAHVSVARADGVARCGVARQATIWSTGWRSPLELRGRLLDPARQVDRGVDHEPAAATTSISSRDSTPTTYRYYIDFAAEYGRRVHDVRRRLVGQRRQHQAQPGHRRARLDRLRAIARTSA